MTIKALTYAAIEQICEQSDMPCNEFMRNLWVWLIDDAKLNESKYSVKIGKELKLRRVNRRNPGNMYQAIRDKLYSGIAMEYDDTYNEI